MRLVKLSCPNCNAKIEVNADMKKFVCNYCGTTTPLTDEIIKANNNSSKKSLKELLIKSMIIISIGIILCFTLICLFYCKNYQNVSSNQKIGHDTSNKNIINEETERIRKLGIEFYEGFYWDDCGKYGNEGRKEFLELFKKVGITVSLENLIRWGDTSNYPDDWSSQYDYDDTKIIVYPKEPYGKKDYTISIEISKIN